MGGLQVVTEYFQATEFSAVEIGYQGQSIHACLLHSVTEGAELRKLFNTYNAICLNGGARVEATIKELEDQQKKLSRRTRDVGRKFISYFKGALYDSSNVIERATRLYQEVYALRPHPPEDVFSINNFLMALTSIRLVLQPPFFSLQFCLPV